MTEKVPDHTWKNTSHLRGQTVVLGVSGGIAAYKAVSLCRLLVCAGAHVIPVLTANAEKFVGSSTFDALGSEAALKSNFDIANQYSIPHVEIARRADLVVVAPATANIIGKYASGIADDLLTSMLLATTCPVLLAPAMHTEMWEQPAVQTNITTLRDRGTFLVGPTAGDLAGGDIGLGRMAEPDEILAAAMDGLEKPLLGKQFLITAGGTREAIDPVRYIGNRSSGKMGYALAQVAARRGATVHLVATTKRDTLAGVRVELVNTAQEMKEAVDGAYANSDVVIMAAAVADFCPDHTESTKIKKEDGVFDLKLVPSVDILQGLGAAKEGQLLVGFAAETTDPVRSGTKKLESKNLDLLFVNDVTLPDSGFEVDTNSGWLLDGGGTICEIKLATKIDVAAKIIDRVEQLLASRYDNE